MKVNRKAGIVEAQNRLRGRKWETLSYRYLPKICPREPTRRRIKPLEPDIFPLCSMGTRSE